MAVFRVPVDLTWNATGSPGVSVFHLRTTEDSGTPGNGLIVSDALEQLRLFYADWVPAYAAAGFSAKFAGEVTDVQTQEALSSTPWTVNAEGANGQAPHVLQICVNWKTSIAARRGRGRTFLGPLGTFIEDTNGTPTDGAITAIRGWANDFVAASQAIAGGAFAVYGQESEGVPGVKVARDIIGASVSDKFSVLRSRRD